MWGVKMKNYMVFDIGGSSVKWSVMNDNAEFVENGSFKTQKDKESFFNEIIDVTNKMKEKHGVQGVAISSPGAVDPDTSIVGGISAIPYIHGPNFREIIKNGTGLNSEIENDANCAALGECWVGSGKDNKDLAFVVCGSGIGGAIVKDKKVHSGIHKHGGEFGYNIVDLIFENGEVKCNTWSQNGSTIHLANKVAERKGLEVGSLNGLDVFKLCEEKDKIALEEVDKYYYTMAIGIYNIQYTFDPEVIVLGGAISDREDYIEQIDSRLEDLMKKGILQGKVKPCIKKCQYGNDANKLGALYNYLQRNN